jgi:general secretion pathway protein M
MAREAGELSGQPVLQVSPMTKESLAASLSALGMTPQSTSITGEFARIQLSGVSFANLVSWLDAQRRENRISVQEATITAQTPVGQVDATLSLRQDAGAGQQ